MKKTRLRFRLTAGVIQKRKEQTYSGYVVAENVDEAFDKFERRVKNKFGQPCLFISVSNKFVDLNTGKPGLLKRGKRRAA